jgi:hypothetical protein
LIIAGLDNISGSKSISLCDVTGALVKKLVFEQGQPASINTASLANGIYVLQLQTEAGTTNFRVVK